MAHGLLLIALAVACGGNGLSTTGPVPATQLGDEYGTAVCEKIFACCSSAEIAAAGFFGGQGPITSLSQCEVQTTFFGNFDPASVGSNAVAYDANAARACIDGINALTCDELQGEDLTILDTSNVPACATITTPRVANGSACSKNYECMSNACFGEPCGVCQPLPAAGGACYTSCTNGFYCVGASASGAILGMCVALGANGSACGTDETCASGYCDSGSACATRPYACTGSGAAAASTGDSL